MTSQASGTFEVKLGPEPAYAQSESIKLGRMTIDKEFHGDLSGSSKGEMLSAMTGVTGSAGYVAMEYVIGTINGRSGGFALQHTGSSHRGELQLSVTVVPDSGTGDLIGLSGTMAVDRTEGKHTYRFEYIFSE